MARSRKKIVKTPRRKLPRIFDCPRCCNRQVIHMEYFNEVQNEINPVTKKPVVLNKVAIGCSVCDLQAEFVVKSQAEEDVDIYCRFADDYRSKNPKLAHKMPPKKKSLI